MSKINRILIISSTRDNRSGRSYESSFGSNRGRQIMMVGEVGESIQPSELEDISNPDLENDGKL